MAELKFIQNNLQYRKCEVISKEFTKMYVKLARTLLSCTRQ